MMQAVSDVLASVGNYGSLIASIVAVMFGGMIVVYLLYRLLHSVIKPKGTFARVMKVFFGALYVLILVVTVLLAAERVGLPVKGLGAIAILAVIVGAVIVFFLLPFLPRVPFMPGHMVEIRGELGIVEAVTAYQVVLRTFDGQTLYLPTPLVMAGPIRNFTDQPRRRIALEVELQPGGDLRRGRAVLAQLMKTNPKVLDEPPPMVYITGISAEKVGVVAYCWVATADWLATRDALWESINQAFQQETSVQLAVPRLFVSGNNG
ncbi:mechanosensitive ion channel family protein [Haliea sp. E17]|uniref:mechanosensitive ion channel family protein n=1 Tax=Haliea sp. E17 TaxID=3401576 RepID=UPI003AAE05C0